MAKSTSKNKQYTLKALVIAICVLCHVLNVNQVCALQV